MSESGSAWLSRKLRKARDGDPIVGWYGGHPRGVRTHEWPRCRVCGAPMCHMMQLNAGPHTRLDNFARLTVFICHATGGRCEDWDPWKGSNAVLLHREVDNSLYDGPPTVRVYRKKRLTVEAPTDELQIMNEVKEQGIAMRDALTQLRHDKLGGGAVWLTGDMTPQSRHGRGPMRLIWQFTTQLIPFDITPDGIGYVFVDPFDESTDAGVMLWQGS